MEQHSDCAQQDEKTSQVAKNIRLSFKYLFYANFLMGTLFTVADALKITNDDFQDQSLYSALFLLTGIHCFFTHKTYHRKALAASSLISAANTVNLASCFIWQPTPVQVSVALNSIIFAGTLSML